MTMTTPHEVAKRLGLRNPDHFALESRWERLNRGQDIETVLTRRQGHTTRNLLAALCHLMDTDQNVLIVGHNLEVTNQMVRQAGDYALKLGLDPRRIKKATSQTQWGIGWNDNQVFVDHVVHEFPGA